MNLTECLKFALRHKLQIIYDRTLQAVNTFVALLWPKHLPLVLCAQPEKITIYVVYTQGKLKLQVNLWCGRFAVSGSGTISLGTGE